MALSHSPKIVTDGLVLYLDAANIKSYPNSGTTWYDVSMNGKNTSLENGAVYDSSILPSIYFDGSNAVGKTTKNVDFVQGTINTWVYPLSNNNNSFFVYTTTAPQSAYTHQLGILSTNQLRSYVYDTGTKLTTSDTLLSLSAWWNVSLTWKDNDYAKTYINGIFQKQVAISTAWKTGTSVWIGSVAGVVGGIPTAFKGYMSNIQFYNKALTETELTQNFNALRGRFGI